MTIGSKIKVQLKAKHSFGQRKNPIIEKEISFYNGDYFMFKGGKTEFRICGNEFYAITGPDRFYTLINE